MYDYERPEAGIPETYEICSHRFIKIIAGTVFSCWWLFAAYMIIASHKNGLASYIGSYGFLAFATWFLVRAADHVIFTRFVVSKGTITRYSAFVKPKTYFMEDITKAVVRNGKGGCGIQIYVGEKKAFEINSLMRNWNLFPDTLRKRGIPLT